MTACPDTLADLERQHDGPIPKGVIALLAERQRILRQRSLVEEITDDLDIARMTLTRNRNIFYGAMRERRKITHALRQAKVGPVISALAFKLMRADDEAFHALRYARSAKKSIAWNEGRLREAMASLAQAAE